MSTTLAWLLVFAAGINSCIGNLLLKKARMGGETGLLAMLLNPYFLGGMCFYGVNVVLFGKALERLPVSSAYPVLAATGFALLIVAAGFVLRLLAGVFVIGELPTAWAALCTLFLALFLSFCKRRSELAAVGEGAGGGQRPVLEQYSLPLLDALINVTATLSVMSYALFSTSTEH